MPTSKVRCWGACKGRPGSWMGRPVAVIRFWAVGSYTWCGDRQCCHRSLNVCTCPLLPRRRQLPGAHGQRVGSDGGAAAHGHHAGHHPDQDKGGCCGSGMLSWTAAVQTPPYLACLAEQLSLKCTAPLPSATLPAAHQQPMCRTANCAAADAVPDQGHAARVPADWGGLAGHAVPQAPQWCGGRGLPQRASRHTRNPLMRLHSEAVDCTLCRCLHPAITLSQSPFHPPSPVGILADEMGLGKTIQTIALLAHLACER